jgi:hypothetical protein
VVKRLSIAVIFALTLTLSTPAVEAKRGNSRAKAVVKFKAAKQRKSKRQVERLDQVLSEGLGYCRTVSGPSQGHLIIECAG